MADHQASTDLTTADGHDRYVPGMQLAAAMREGHEGRYQWFTEQVDLRDLRVLDFGCGSGYGSRTLADAGAEVVGIDISASAVAYARARYGGAGGVTFHAADLCRPLDGLDLGVFDVVVSSEVLEHVPDVFGFLRNIASVLIPEGVVMIGTPNRRFSYRRGNGMLLSSSHVMELTPEHLYELLHLWFEELIMYVHLFPEQEKPPSATLPARVKRGGRAMLVEILGPDRASDLIAKLRRVTTLDDDESYATEYIRAEVDGPEFDLPGARGMVCIGRRLRLDVR